MDEILQPHGDGNECPCLSLNRSIDRSIDGRVNKWDSCPPKDKTDRHHTTSFASGRIERSPPTFSSLPRPALESTFGIYAARGLAKLCGGFEGRWGWCTVGQSCPAGIVQCPPGMDKRRRQEYPSCMMHPSSSRRIRCPFCSPNLIPNYNTKPYTRPDHYTQVPSQAPPPPPAPAPARAARAAPAHHTPCAVLATAVLW